MKKMNSPLKIEKKLANIHKKNEIIYILEIYLRIKMIKDKIKIDWLLFIHIVKSNITINRYIHFLRVKS
jgi:hypothetical protein